MSGGAAWRRRPSLVAPVVVVLVCLAGMALALAGQMACGWSLVRSLGAANEVSLALGMAWGLASVGGFLLSTAGLVLSLACLGVLG